MNFCNNLSLEKEISTSKIYLIASKFFEKIILNLWSSLLTRERVKSCQDRDT